MLGERDGADHAVWIVGEFDDGLIVMREREAQGLATLHGALQDAATWADLVTSIEDHPELLEEVRERYGDELPDGSEAFNADEVRGFPEGDWPAHPRELMIGAIPDSVASLGVVAPTLFGEGLLEIPPGRRPEIIRRLERLGVSYREDDGLIARACGAWRFG